jgi:hypothetical protein
MVLVKQLSSELLANCGFAVHKVSQVLQQLLSMLAAYIAALQ